MLPWFQSVVGAGGLCLSLYFLTIIKCEVDLTYGRQTVEAEQILTKQQNVKEIQSVQTRSNEVLLEFFERLDNVSRVKDETNPRSIVMMLQAIGFLFGALILQERKNQDKEVKSTYIS